MNEYIKVNPIGGSGGGSGASASLDNLANVAVNAALRGNGSLTLSSDVNDAITLDLHSAASKQFVVSGNSRTEEFFYINAAGDCVTGCGPNGAGELDPTSTSGFLWIPRCNGTPTGTPNNGVADHSPILYDYAADKIWIFNGTWKFAQLA